MGLLDNYTGIGMSPRPKWQHQHVIRRALLRTSEELEEQGLFMLSESTVTRNWDDLAPDLVIFNQRHQPLSIIEITTRRECKRIISKCDELIERFPAAEFFVYDYDSEILYGFRADTQEWLTSENYVISSRYLTNPLLEYLV